MADRNTDRMGIPRSGPLPEDGAQAAAAVQAATPPPPPTPPPSSAGRHFGGDDTPDFLKFANPTEWVALPSGGKFYPPGHPFHMKEQVEIRYMTAKEEDILASRSLLKKGLAIDRLIKSVCVDKNLPINSLLTGDKNALMVATRVTGYGEEYKVNLQCPVCAARSEFNWDLSVMRTKEPDEEFMSEHSIEYTAEGYKITLPKTKACVSVRYLNGKDEDYLDKQQTTKGKSKLGETRMTDQFRIMITDINGHSDRSIISKFSDNMPANDARILRKSYAELKPDIDQSMNFVCPECSMDTEVEMPMTAQFFWPD